MAHRELNERPQEVPGGWSLPIGDGVVSQITVDYSFGIAVDVDTIVRFETPFTWFDGMSDQTIDPGDVEQLGRLLGLLHQRVSSVTATEPGSHLTVEFMDGQRLSTSAHDEFEAWTATVSWGIPEQRSLYVATPGG